MLVLGIWISSQVTKLVKSAMQMPVLLFRPPTHVCKVQQYKASWLHCRGVSQQLCVLEFVGKTSDRAR